MWEMLSLCLTVLILVLLTPSSWWASPTSSTEHSRTLYAAWQEPNVETANRTVLSHDSNSISTSNRSQKMKINTNKEKL